MTDAESARLAAWLCATLPADSVALSGWRRLSGGAIQQNFAVDAVVAGGTWAGSHAWVLRTDSAAVLEVSRPRAEEFALLQAAQQAGVAVPTPLLLCEDREVLGRPFFLMQRITGVAAGHLVVRSETLGGGRAALAAELGRQLARVHRIRPPCQALGFLGPPPASPAASAIGLLRGLLDRQAMPRPMLEWGLRHLERQMPAAAEPVLCHNDFRTGNVMVDAAGVVGVLDWEFAAWGDAHQDIGWLCARCWRFGSDAQPVGGIGPWAPFRDAYEEGADRRIDPAQVAWWQLLATLRWAVIAIGQAERHISGTERSLELALTGHIAAELELEVMRMTSPADA